MDDYSTEKPVADEPIESPAQEPYTPKERRWVTSVLWAALIVGIGVILSAVLNPLVDRAVHWDWMAGIAPISFALFALALRRRWV